MSALSPHEYFELHILKRLSSGRQWVRSFHRVKPVLDRLIEGGRARRVAPRLSRSANMVEITEAGQARLASLQRRAE